MSQSAQWEVRLDLGSVSFHEIAPHEPSGGVVREREVDLLVEELFEFFLRAFFRMTATT